MPYRANYPATVREILRDGATFKPAALRAVRELARAKPWRGALRQRAKLFRRLNRQLAEAYSIRVPKLHFHCDGQGSSGASCYRPAEHSITLSGRLSVVTYLHEFGHARGMDERQAVRWSVNLFRRVFPRSFAACQQVGHTLIRPEAN